jgi:hypothetical protein
MADYATVAAILRAFDTFHQPQRSLRIKAKRGRQLNQLE